MSVYARAARIVSFDLLSSHLRDRALNRIDCRLAVIRMLFFDTKHPLTVGGRQMRYEAVEKQKRCGKMGFLIKKSKSLVNKTVVIY